jgi:cyclopropane-fatty-acyl-phospholipid synthase
LFLGNENLEQAQKNKYANIIKYLPSKTSKILEIGCGWGGFMQEALNYSSDVKIKGLTISNEQYRYVKDKFESNSNINLQIQDYRLEKDLYDAVVSIEMFEAVGREYWDVYIDKIYNCLLSGGIAVIQTITIEDSAFEKYSKTSDFIRHFIFPGGFLPTVEIFTKLAKTRGFDVVSTQSFGDSYCKTLLLWLAKFDEVKNEILSLGFNEKFIKKWRFYLSYCASSFKFKRTNVYQFVLKKP